MQLNRLFSLMLIFFNTSSDAQVNINAPGQQPEIIYHLFQRSFYDGNGDSQGDLNGIISQLDYLQDLGVTSILLLPLYQSVYYHNYFADDFEKIDEEYGSMQDFLHLVKAVHQRGMKIYLDMETQYVTEDHVWWKDSYGNLKSKYADYILYDDTAHTKPSTIVFGLNGLTGYNNTFKKITTVNLRSKKVLDYNFKLFKYFADPNNDGKFDDGVDGFRLDHMMDTLDNKPELANLFSGFWTPLFTGLKKVNPNLQFIAEQANWFSYGSEYFDKGNVDRVFAFGLQMAIASFDKKKIAETAASTFNRTPAGRAQVVFIENHDMKRFASTVNNNPDKEKIGAALNLLIGGIPSIYYGQELGMFGSGGFSKFNNTDGNDIPQREAFEWYKQDSGKGMAIWYKNSGPWWDSTNIKPDDGISFEEEKNDPNSLYNFYKTMIALHKTNKAIAYGDYVTIENNNKSVFTFMRSYKDEKVLVAINLSGSVQFADISPGQDKLLTRKMSSIYRNKEPENKSDVLSFELKPYAIEVWSAH
ncbi:MAG TPA: alpha-amylase family glycosyl hydrolase [Parafilimonas sp.]|nr:alpha-amylase family glycosyl hydrolase [Parafilimonas sp.]